MNNGGMEMGASEAFSTCVGRSYFIPGDGIGEIPLVAAGVLLPVF